MKIIEVECSASVKMGIAEHWESRRMKASLDDGEDAIMQMGILREKLEATLPYQVTQNYFDNMGIVKTQTNDYSPSPSTSKTQSIINQINQCSDITVLKSFEKLANMNYEKHPEVMEAYNNKMKSYER